MTRKHASAASEPAKDTSCWHEEVETLKQACFQGYPESARYVQISIGSRNSAIHNAYRTSLRPSSLFEPRHPSLKVVNNYFSGEAHQMMLQWCAEAKVQRKLGNRSEVGRQSNSTLLPSSFQARASMNVTKHLHPRPDPHKRNAQWFVWMRANDPSAGSPTETLLRLLLPLSDKVH